MDDQAARSPGDQYIVSKPTTFSSPAVTTERELHPNEVFLDSTSHSVGLDPKTNTEPMEPMEALRNNVSEIPFTSESLEPTVDAVSSSRVPNYSKNVPKHPMPMSAYEGPYAGLRFEERFDQERVNTESDKSEPQGCFMKEKQNELSEDVSEKNLSRRYFHQLGDSGIPRFWYEPGRCLPIESLFDSEEKENILIEVRIAADYLTLHNPSVKSRNIWGDTRYTEDTDLVAAVMHSGFVFLGYTSPNTFVELAVLIQVTKYDSETYFPCSRRFCYQSREWKQERGYFYTICCVAVVLAGGSVWQLQSLPLSDFNFLNLLRTQNTRDRVLELPPWPVSFSSDPSEKSNFSISEDMFYKFYTFNLSNELCFCYSLSLFLDNDLNSSSWFSQRLKSEVVYLETYSERYELALNANMQSFNFCRVKNPEKLDYQTTLVCGVPLPASQVICLEENLHWNEILWGVTKVRIRERLYPFQRVMFVPRTTTLQQDHLMDTSQ